VVIRNRGWVGEDIHLFPAVTGSSQAAATRQRHAVRVLLWRPSRFDRAKWNATFLARKQKEARSCRVADIRRISYFCHERDPEGMAYLYFVPVQYGSQYLA
jgi:hypothetical protein